MSPNFFQQLPPFLRWERLDEVLLRRRQYALQTGYEKIADQVRMNVLRTPAEVILLQEADYYVRRQDGD